MSVASLLARTFDRNAVDQAELALEASRDRWSASVELVGVPEGADALGDTLPLVLWMITRT